MRWVLGAIALLIIGMVFQLGLLVYAMYVLLGVIFASWYLAREWTEKVSATRECSRTSAQIGETAAVIVTLQNRGRLPVPWLLVEDSLPREALSVRPPRITLEGKRFGILQLPGGGHKQLLYQVRFHTRGYFQIGPLLLESGDLFGLHRRFRVETEPAYVLVYPRVLAIDGYNFASRRPIGEVRLTYRLFEDPTRIAGVREYRAGDSLNRIHWRATARTGMLHSKVYEPSCVAGMTLLLDFHRSSYPARGEPHRSELAVTTVASLANAVYQLGQQFGLLTNGRDAVDRIREEGVIREFQSRATARNSVGMAGQSDRLRPVVIETRRGAEQFQRILETLARVELSDGLNFAQFVGEVASRLPRDATVVAVLAAVSPETAIALGNLRRSGFAVTAVLALPAEEHDQDDAGRLLAEGVPVRTLDSEAAIAHLCAEEWVR